ncbi:hypothetical protein RMATCC62417_03331 [Rhizopus microsporus]|nr:hypothetical protein RMATCC62417_03331 [Rhizopus microsporus]CEI87102.1 hypothetical protein RMCBS344292_01522 [Rhizopus microsporus]
MSVQEQPTMDSPKTKPDDKKKKKERIKKKPKRHSRKPTLKTKVVVRRLPPLLQEDVLMEAVKPWINEQTTDYSFFVPGKIPKSKGKENIFSRAYFHLKTMEAVIAFHQGFDGRPFTDSRGNESRAVVEFAPYQKIPKEHKTTDARQGTIDEDPDYVEFLNFLEAEKNKSKEAQDDANDGLNPIEKLENRIAMVTAKTLAAEQANKPKTTPLLEHLRAQKAAQAAAKAKKAAKKNARRKAEKEKNVEQQQQQQQQQQQPSASESKKPKRDRNKRKKEGERKEGDRGEPSPSASNRGSDSPNRKDKPRGPRKDNPNKPKRTKKVDGKQPQVVKILGRQQQPSSENNSQQTTNG